MEVSPVPRSQNKERAQQTQCIITDSVYPYRPLSRDIEEIRLVAVAPASSPSEPLTCSLHHTALNQLPQYKALSYTWGAEFPCRSIILDGITVSVRENLECALRALRRVARGEPLSIWVDAICINQHDNAEKSKQISKMRLIYEQATMVAIWIGPGSSNSSPAFQLIRDLSTCPRESLSALIRDPLRSLQIQALRELYYREYWWRIWVVQEVVLAKNATIYCGDESIPWTVLYTIGDILNYVREDLSRVMHRDPDSVFKLLSSGPRSLRLPEISATDQAPLLELLRAHRSKFSSDPRDKVYGLVGISDLRNTFVIDYSWSVHDVYVYTAQCIINTTRSLDVICARGHKWKDCDLPTWVPSWVRNDLHTEHRVMGLHIRTPAFKAAGDTLARTVFSNDNLMLDVEGVMIGTIHCLGEAFDLNTVLPQPAMGESIPKLRAACQVFMHWWNLFCRYRGDSISEQDVFERTIFGGSWSPAYEVHRPHRLQLFSSLSKSLFPSPPHNDIQLPSTTNFAETGEIDNEQNRKAMVSAASLRMHGNRLVITDSKHVGLTPSDSAAGDIICVFLGCSFPVVVRPANGSYSLIGEVYIDELMNGEAISLLQEGRYTLEIFQLR